MAVSLCDIDERAQLRAIEREMRQTLRIETQLPEGATCDWTPQVVSRTESGSASPRRDFSSRRGGRSRPANRPARSTNQPVGATGSARPRRRKTSGQTSGRR